MEGWTALTQEQKNPWNILGERLTNPNRLGVPRRMSGRTLWIRHNVYKLLYSQTLQTFPPQGILPPSSYPITWTTGATDMIATWDFAGETQDITGMLFACRFFGRESYRRLGYTYCGVALVSQASPSFDFYTSMTYNIGVPAAGERVRLRMVTFFRSPVYASVIINEQTITRDP